MKEPAGPAHVSAALLATAAGCAAYFVSVHWSVPGLWYLPLARAWSFGAKPAGVAMSWYGRTLIVLAVALLGGAVGRAVPWTSARWTRLTALLAGACLLVAVGTCVAANVDRPTKPLALPSGQPVVCDPAP